MQGKTGGRVGVRHVSESTLRGTHHAGWDSWWGPPQHARGAWRRLFEAGPWGGGAASLLSWGARMAGGG